MKHLTQQAETLGSALGTWAVKRPWLTLILSLFLVMLVAQGASRLSFSGDYQIFFSDENPELQTFLNFEATYGSSDNVSFVIFPKNGTIYDPEVLDAVHALTTQAWNLPYVSRVDSLSNFQHTYAEGDELIVEDLIFDPAETRAEGALARLRNIAENEPLLHRFITSENGEVTVINAVLQVDRKQIELLDQAVAKAREIRAEILANHPAVADIQLVGAVMLSAAFSEVAILDSMLLVPAMYALILVVMLIVLRSLMATIATLVIVILSSMAGMGAGGWLGIQLTPVSMSATTIILTIAIADSVHVILAIRSRMRQGIEKSQAIIGAIATNTFPVSLTSITTIVGFLSLNFSDSPPFHHLGNMTAAGLLAAWFLSLTLLPALLSILPMRYRTEAEISNTSTIRMMGTMADNILKYRLQVFALTISFCIAAIAMIPNLTFNDVWSKYFAENIPIRQAIDQAQPYFGTEVIEFIVDSGAPNDVLTPAFLQDVENFANWLSSRPEITHVYSISDVMKRLNRNLHGDDPSYDRIPDNRKLASQYLLVYEISLPYGLDLNDRIDIDRQKTRVTATIQDLSTHEARELIEASLAWIAANNQSGVQATSTGAAMLFNYIADRNVQAMLEGSIWLVLIIFIIMWLAFRSVAVASLSVLLNVVPILATFGIWAVLVGQVGFSIAIVGAVAVGLVIDYTVHILSKYDTAFRQQGQSISASIRYAFETAGVAIVSTTLILAAGFALLATSGFKLNADMGLMTAIAIVLAMLVNFLVMPPLLSFQQPRQQQETQHA